MPQPQNDVSLRAIKTARRGRMPVQSPGRTRQPQQRPSTTRAFALALMGAVMTPQLALGLSMPAMQRIASALDVSLQTAQATTVLYMAGYAVSMLLAGLLADRFGARRVQLWGLALAAVAALACVFAVDIWSFAAARFLSALGGCVGTVTTRLIVRTEYPESARMQILTSLAAVLALTPCIAPLLGGALLPLLGWQGLFVVIAGAALATMILFAVVTRHMSAPPAADLPGLRRIGRVYADNLANRAFRRYAGAISLVWMAYFAFVSCSPNALQAYLGLSSAAYGAVLAVSAMGYVVGSTVARRLSARCDIDDILRLAATVGALGGGLMLLALWLWPQALLALMLPMMVVLAAAGMTIPAAQAGLLRSVTAYPGLSSGQFFFLQMGAGAMYALAGNAWPVMTPQGLAWLVAMPLALLLGLAWAGRGRQVVKGA